MPPVLPLPIPAGQLCRYGGFTFPVTTKTIGVDVHPVPDSSGRTVKWSEFSLTLEFVLAGDFTDDTVLLALAELTKYGSSLNYVGRGIPVAINVGPSRDVEWGPKPDVVSLKPFGGPGIACKVLWRVTGRIPTCFDSTFDGWPAEFCFSLQYGHDASGLTTRTYSGRITIPGTRPPGDERAMPDSVDYWRERITPIVPLRFRRTASTFTVEENKLSATFSVTDTKMPGRNTPPTGIVKAQFHHSYSSPPGKWYTWDVVCNGTYELGIDTPPSLAVSEFFRLIDERKKFTEIELGNAPPRKDGKKNKAVMVPVQFSMAEPDAYGLPIVQLSLRYKIVDANLEEMLAASGLWQPLAAGNPREWRTFMEGVTGPRGVDGLTFTTNDDFLVDLCQTTSPVVPDDRPKPSQNPQGKPKAPLKKIFPKPKPEASFLKYSNKATVSVQNNNVPVVTMPSKPMGPEQDALDAANSLGVGAFAGVTWELTLPELPETNSPLSVNDGPPIDTRKYGRVDVQRRGRALTYVVMEGHAMRAGYPIPRPDLINVGGLTPVPMNREGIEGFEHEMIANLGIEVYAARWRFRYLVPDAEGNQSTIGPIEVPPNPLEALGEASV